MSDVYEKSLALMDEYFESVSDDEFLSDYLLAEKSIGPTVNEFLSEASFFEGSYIVFNSFFDSEKFTAKLIKSKKIQSNSYEVTYSANDDDIYELAA